MEIPFRLPFPLRLLGLSLLQVNKFTGNFLLASAFPPICYGLISSGSFGVAPLHPLSTLLIEVKRTIEVMLGDKPSWSLVPDSSSSYSGWYSVSFEPIWAHFALPWAYIGFISDLTPFQQQFLVGLYRQSAVIVFPCDLRFSPAFLTIQRFLA